MLIALVMQTMFSGVVPGGAGDAMVPPDFGRSVNPISTSSKHFFMSTEFDENLLQ